MPQDIAPQSETQTARQNRRRKFQPKPDAFNAYFPEEHASRPMSATIRKSQTEVYSLLRDLKNFPLFLENLEKVEEAGSSRANWYFRDGSASVMIPMAVATERMNELLIWKTEDKAGFSYTIGIYLEPAQADRGTIVRMKVVYDSAMGDMVGVIEKLFGADAQILSKRNLQRFKAFCETGHVPTTQGQPTGRTDNEDETFAEEAPFNPFTH